MGNPKHLRFQQVESAQIPRSLPDAALGLINGNVALESGLTPSKDARFLEKGEPATPTRNILVVPAALKDDPRVKALAAALSAATGRGVHRQEVPRLGHPGQRHELTARPPGGRSAGRSGPRTDRRG